MTTTEKYFRAYRKHNDFGLGDVKLGGILPNITQHYPDFKKWVLEKMEGEGYEPEIEEGKFYWVLGNNAEPAEEIKDNEILRAAVIAATRYFEAKK